MDTLSDARGTDQHPSRANHSQQHDGGGANPLTAVAPDAAQLVALLGSIHPLDAADHLGYYLAHVRVARQQRAITPASYLRAVETLDAWRLVLLATNAEEA